MSNVVSVGSQWRLWDLHLHSTASDGSSSPDDIILKAKELGINVVALTDHHTARNIDTLKELGQREGVSVIAGVEFRTEYGNKSVHMIGLFPEEFNNHKLDASGIYDLILAPLNVSKAKIIAKAGEINSKTTDEKAFKDGLFKVQVDFKKAANKIHEYGGIVSVHAGSKSNSIDEEIKHSGTAPKNARDLYSSLGPLKDELLRDGYVDVCEIRNENDDKDFYYENFSLPSITASDAHSPDEIGRSPIWIKGDPCFEGLKQALSEPLNRICFRDKPEVLDRYDKNPEMFIKQMRVTTIPGKTQRDKWFSNVPEIPFNAELVAIIGNKGHGKSAITDFLGLAGRSKNQSEFSFLNPKRFLALPDHKCFQVNVEYGDGSTSTDTNLEYRIQDEVEKVSYLPQSYIESICSDVGTKFEMKVKELVFSYIPLEYRLGAKGYDEYIRIGTQALQIEEERLRSSIRVKITELMNLEKKLIPSYKKQIENSVLDYDKQIVQLTEPVKVLNPDIDEDEKEKKSTLLAKIEELKSQKNSIIQNITNITSTISDANVHINTMHSFIQECESIKKRINQIIMEYEDVSSRFGIDLTTVISLRFKPDIVQKQVDDCKRCIQRAEDKKKESLIKVNSINDLIDKSTTKISTRQKEYLEYISKLEGYNKKLARLTEAKNVHKKELEYLSNNLRHDVSVVHSELKDLSQKIFDIILQRVCFEENCFKYIDDSIQTWQSLIPSVTDHSLAFTSSIITSSDCVSIIQDEYISAGVKSTFCGKEEAMDKLTAILNPGSSVNKEDVSNIINQIINALYYDLRDTPKTPIEDIANQFRKEGGVSKQPRFYEYLFSCEFLSTITEIRSNSKSINELSPGEKGTVLLVIYLLLDKSTNPLIIDQPEENLDNQSVYQILRPFILEAKKRRQIIIVTHNPNIAVTCDAEQLICVHIDKSDKNQFSFESGSIENPVINKHVSDILEGTLEAFNNRNGKYIRF